MRRRTQGVVVSVAAVGAVVALRPGTRGNKLMRRGLSRAGRRAHYAGGRLQGARYRLSGRHPDPTVEDNVLADRIRSQLGGLEHRLDLPHVHVMVERHVALLHGEVSSEADAEEIEHAVAAVEGVAGVESYVHVGLIRGDTRPSQGRAVHPPSAALAQLRSAAQAAGVSSETTDVVLRGILATFADRLPQAQRGRIGSHLPTDVCALLAPPRRTRPVARSRTVHDLVSRIAGATAALPEERVEDVTAAVLHTLRRLLPDDAGNVAAVLPPELRALWQGSPAE